MHILMRILMYILMLTLVRSRFSPPQAIWDIPLLVHFILAIITIRISNLRFRSPSNHQI